MSAKVLWMEVTRDQYELPVAVAGDQHELARLTGTTPQKIKDIYSKFKRGEIKTCKYRRVEVDDD